MEDIRYAAHPAPAGTARSRGGGLSGIPLPHRAPAGAGGAHRSCIPLARLRRAFGVGFAQRQRPTPKTRGTNVERTTNRITIDARFSHIPARIICLMLTSPEPNATAFDGVATGNI